MALNLLLVEVVVLEITKICVERSSVTIEVRASAMGNQTMKNSHGLPAIVIVVVVLLE